MKFIYEIPGSFWGLFRSVNRGIYMEALLTIDDEYQYNNFFLSREACVQILADMCARRRFQLEKEETETEGGEATEQQYERLLEKRVEDTLECVEGVGKVKVMLTLKSSEEKVVEKDSQREENEITEEDSKGGSRVSEDRSLSHTSIYEQKADGTQTPYVSKEMAPEIEGMVIAADGGDDPVVVKNLTEAVQALFGVEAHKIKIMKRTNA